MVPVFRSVMTTSSFCARKARSPERRRASSSVRDGRLRTLGRDANAGDETRGASIGAKPFVTKCFHSRQGESTAVREKKSGHCETAPAGSERGISAPFLAVGAPRLLVLRHRVERLRDHLPPAIGLEQGEIVGEVARRDLAFD